MSNNYKPPVLRSTGSKGTEGEADLLWSDTKVKITFEENETAYKILRDELPEYAQEWDLERAFVTMDSENEKVFSIRPVSGIFTLRTKCFSRQNEEEPPVHQARNGKWGTYYTFNALLEITEGKYKGAIYPYCLNEKFVNVDGLVGFKTNQNGEYSERTIQLKEYLELNGAWEDGELEYNDNNLPAFEKRIKRAKKEFQGLAKKGYIESLFAVDFERGEDEEDENSRKKQAKNNDVDDDFPPKKSPLKKSSKDEDDLD